jgi:hypothetical protein
MAAGILASRVAAGGEGRVLLRIRAAKAPMLI